VGSGTSAVSESAPISGLTPNTTYHYGICATNAYGPSCGADSTFTTTNPPATAGLSPTTATVDYGGSLKITTSMANYTSCALSGGDSGWAAFSYSNGAQYTTTALYSSTTYWMTCTGPGGSSTAASSVITVKPAKPTIDSFTVNNGGGQTIYYAGGVTRGLKWSTSNASYCTGNWATGHIGTSTGTGTWDVTAKPGSSYTLTCYNDAGDSVTSTKGITYHSSYVITHCDSHGWDCGCCSFPGAAGWGEGAKYPSQFTGSTNWQGIVAYHSLWGNCYALWYSPDTSNLFDWVNVGKNGVLGGGYDWDQTYYWKLSWLDVGRDCDGY
jgi:hypothetical protein